MPRRYKKRKYKRKRRMVVPRPFGGLGNRHLQRFKYVDRVQLDPSATVAATYSFRANSLFDPDYTSTGHQPIGFDEVMPFYNHFTVIGAKIKVTYISQQAAATSGTAIVGIQTSGNPTPTTTINDIYEQGNSTVKLMTSGDAQGYVIAQRKLSVRRFLGQDPMDEDANAGSASANPSEVIYFHLFATSTDSDALINPDPIECLVELEQLAWLHEPKQLSGS